MQLGLPERAKEMTTYLPQDVQQARQYRGKKLRRVLCAPLETVTDDYLHKHGWIVESVFPPISGLALDKPAKENSLIVVIRRPRQE